MAHHLASLIEATRTAEGEARQGAEERCADAVLELWRHRNCFPEGRRPLEPAESILQTLEALDPSAAMPYFHRDVWDELRADDQEEPTAEYWLKAARSLDRAARTLIQFMLVLAAGESADRTRKWVTLADGAGAAGIDVRALQRLLLLHDGLAGTGNPDVEAMRERLAALDEFQSMSSALRQDLEKRLAELRTEDKVTSRHEIGEGSTG